MILCVNDKCIQNKNFGNGCRFYIRKSKVCNCPLYEAWTVKDSQNVYNEITKFMRDKNWFTPVFDNSRMGPLYSSDINKPEESMEEFKCKYEDCDFYNEDKYNNCSIQFGVMERCRKYKDWKRTKPCENADCIDHNDSDSGCSTKNMWQLKDCSIYRRLYE